MSGSDAAVEPRLRELLGGVLALRVLLWGWALLVIIVDARSHTLVNGRLAALVLTAVFAWICWLSVSLFLWPQRMVRPLAMAVDLGLAATIIVADHWVYADRHSQSFGSALPVAAVISCGAILGTWGGALCGAGLGVANAVAVAMDTSLDGRWMAVTGTLVLFVATGLVSGYLSVRLRHADSEVAAARAQQEWARTLHDGVLQTLAVVQRRSTDPELVGLARRQEQELRAMLHSDDVVSSRWIAAEAAQVVDVAAEVRRQVAHADATFGVPITVVVIESDLRPRVVAQALAAATGEAIANCAKHAGPSTVTVCVDCDVRGVIVTVNDDGVGFDPATVPEGTGLTHSVRSRLAEVDGGVEITSAPGRGTEVELWIP